jgi:hypothetical protein
MPRYLVEREFPDGLNVSINDVGADVFRKVADNNSEFGVTWLHSYFTSDRRHSYCVYDGPTPEAIRRAAACNKLPISQITEVRVLDPYFFK